jgi:hypothetical protein
MTSFRQIEASQPPQRAQERRAQHHGRKAALPLQPATTMETVLFDIQADHLKEFRVARPAHPDSRTVVHAMFGRSDPNANRARLRGGTRRSRRPASRVAFCVWPICPISRSTGSAGMRQPFGAKPVRSLFALHALDRRKPHDSARRFRLGIGPGCVKTHTSENCRRGIQSYVLSVISFHDSQFL